MGAAANIVLQNAAPFPDRAQSGSFYFPVREFCDLEQADFADDRAWHGHFNFSCLSIRGVGRPIRSSTGNHRASLTNQCRRDDAEPRLGSFPTGFLSFSFRALLVVTAAKLR
jgi:hypothetical protein